MSRVKYYGIRAALHRIQSWISIHVHDDQTEHSLPNTNTTTGRVLAVLCQRNVIRAWPIMQYRLAYASLQTRRLGFLNCRIIVD